VTELLEVVWIVTQALDTAEVPHTVGGSLASSFAGEPRASIDADILVDMAPGQSDVFLAALGDAFYAEAASLARAIATRTSTNLIHRSSGIKVDLFVASSRLDRRQLARRRRVVIASAPERAIYVHSAEDILLQKLYWYRLGGGVSERQWRDVLGLIVVQGSHLDRAYIEQTAADEDLTGLWQRAIAEAEGA
jgi:hypothetical protein